MLYNVGMQTAEYQRADAAHHVHPFTDMAALGAGARIITRARGVYCWDSDGNKILDAMSGLWCVNMGYGQTALVEAAARQMRELPYYNSFFQCTTPPTVALSERLAEVAPAGFRRVFYTGSGSEANDTVVRLLRYYWQLRGEPQRRIIIARDNAYHGSTIASASLGGMTAMHKQGGLPIPDVAHVAQPYWYGEGRGAGETPAQTGARAAAALRAKIVEVGGERVAGFIGEPVQGAGGVVIPPPNYWREAQAICDEFGVPIIADEVICGFGRLGHWFGLEHFGIAPKMISMAKGLSSGYLPIGAVMLHDDIADVLAGGGEVLHGYTYSGHPTCAAVARANLDLMRESGVVERVREETAPYLQACWRQLGAHKAVGESRGLGMVAALELVVDADADGFEAGAAGSRCRDLSVGNGLIMRAVRDTMIIAPPLIISKSEVDELVEKAAKTLDQMV